MPKIHIEKRLAIFFKFRNISVNEKSVKHSFHK
jgi:hypothetical protein